MKKRVQATVTPASVWVDCPRCDEPIETPNGGYLWDVDSDVFNEGFVQTCPNCHAVVVLPKGLGIAAQDNLVVNVL